MKNFQKNITTLFLHFKHDPVWLLILAATAISVFSTIYYYQKGLILAYGDAESHLNIAKRIVGSITPGFAQLGGVWLPLPHILMLPFVLSNFLWQTGLAGAIVSGISFVISSVIIYQIINLLTKNKQAGLVGTLVFLLNANILYMQSTPMSELPLIVFFLLSLFFYFLFLQDDSKILTLIAAGFFGFCATLSRYDGWFLVIFEVVGLFIFYFPRGLKNHVLEGKVILFSTVSFFGIFLWLLWDKLILGDAFYFTNSPFSAKSQQKGWLSRGELPAYKNIWESFLYYVTTSLQNIGFILFVLATIGFVIFLIDRKRPIKQRAIISLLLFVPFIFYVATMYLGQSVIFIPGLTPPTFQWQLFNVRYGIMMVPIAAIFIGYLYKSLPKLLKPLIIVLICIQSFFFFSGKIPILTLLDGTKGLSAASHPDAQYWVAKHYDGGLILLDDYARTISITQSHLPMQNVIYIGNKPYWQESLSHPEKYVKWIVLQKNDAVWNNLYTNPTKQKNLYTYFTKVYTSPNILIFKRNTKKASQTTQKTSF